MVTIYQRRFEEILGRKISVKEMGEYLPWLGLDIEEIGEDFVKIEYNPNRPDFGTPVGIARYYKGIRGEETGLIRYSVKKGQYRVYVDPSVAEVRPYIVGAVVKGLDLDEEKLSEIIEFQEDLHNGIGRKRRKVAIGLHNLDAVKFPVTYKTVDSGFSFIPLEFEEEVTIKEILEHHPKGREYGHILSGKDRYPIIIDKEGIVLSFPPIINGIYTSLAPGVRDIFIDVTGTDLETISKTLDILVTTLADYGGELYSVEIVHGKKTFETPKLEYREISIGHKKIIDLLGLTLSPEEVIKALEASRFAAFYDREKKNVTAVVPPYRVDILHPVDLVEEVAIGYGFWRIQPEMPSLYTMGNASLKEKVRDKIIDLMIGFGFQEAINPVLTNPEEQYVKMEIKPDDYIEVKAPKSMLYRILRTWVIPSLLTNLYRSKSAEYPQYLFEIGPVVMVKKNKVIEKEKMAAVIISSETGYSEIKSIFDSMMKTVGIDNYEISETEHPSFISGRVGKIYIGKLEFGLIGEIHPKVLSNFQLTLPVTAFEIDFDYIFEVVRKRGKF